MSLCCCCKRPNEVSPAEKQDAGSPGQAEVDASSRGDVAGDVCRIFGPFFALLVRIVLTAWCVFTIYLVVVKKDEPLYWLMALPLILMVVEGAYTIVRRGGQERKW